MIEFVIVAIVSSFVVTYLTNPFAKYSIIRLPYQLKLKGLAHDIIDRNHKLTVHTSMFWKGFAWYQSGLYILTTRYLHQKSSSSTSIQSIIEDIHALRFNPNKLLLISGDHFNGLFVRNLGVFYYPTLDANVFISEQDWRRRQEVYLQTVAYALGVFRKSPELTTTIVSTGRHSATTINFYSQPSDSLYGILYSLAVLLGEEHAGSELYKKSERLVDTQRAAKQLLDEYRDVLIVLYGQYRDSVFNETTKLIKKDVHLSGAKDITKRSSAFYDNVIFWKTTQLAMKLGIIKKDTDFLHSLRQTILGVFWLEDEGYFLEDLSPESLKQKYYTSDWLIVLSTGFLKISHELDRMYFVRSLEYIKKNHIARPFAIKYHNDTRAHRQFMPVRLAVASYGGDAIWSFWGMEYIKVNLLLHRYTHQAKYSNEAEYHISRYQENIQKYKGFPEVYDSSGTLLKTPLYKSILMTGWVVGFEQVLAMHEAVTKE